MQEKKRLEDTISELRQQLQAVGSPSTPGAMRGGAEAQQSTPAPLSEESKEVMREMDSSPEVRQMRSELSDTRLELQRMTEEVSTPPPLPPPPTGGRYLFSMSPVGLHRLVAQI